MIRYVHGLLLSFAFFFSLTNWGERDAYVDEDVIIVNFANQDYEPNANTYYLESVANWNTFRMWLFFIV